MSHNTTTQYTAKLINRLRDYFDQMDQDRKGYILFTQDDNIKRPVTIQQLERLIRAIETEGYHE